MSVVTGHFYVRCRMGTHGVTWLSHYSWFVCELCPVVDDCRSITAKPTYIKKEKDIPRLPEI